MYATLLLLASFSAVAVGFSQQGKAFVNARTGASELKMAVTLEPLPYEYDALAPYINEQTLRIHHGKHHAKYVATTNAMIAGTDMEGDDQITIARKAFGNNQGLFNNAAQSFNHEFYWRNMKVGGGGMPGPKLMALIDKDLGGYDAFRADFTAKANTAFGSGWAWLSITPEGLKVTNTIGANNPLTEAGYVPLLTCDVWEHAYYLDYQNMRATYVDTFMDKLVNWDAVEARIPV
jgi:Fe-Mn family superoxide dismutase